MAQSLRDQFEIPPPPEVPDEQLREILEQSRQMVPVDWCPTHQRYLTAQELDGDG